MVGFGAFRRLLHGMRLHLGDHMAYARAGVRESAPGFACDRCLIVRYWRRYSNSVEIESKHRRDSALDSCMNTQIDSTVRRARGGFTPFKRACPAPFCRTTLGCELFDSSRQYRGRLYAVIQLIEG